MGYDHLNLFFLEPMINIKQNHLVKHAVKKHIAKNNLPLYNGDWAESKWTQTVDGYRAWATACGRHLELTDGASNLQKLKTVEYWSLDVSNEKSYQCLKNSTDPTLSSYLKLEDKTALNYTKGLFNLASNRKLVQYLNENKFVNKDNQLLNLKLLFGKEYDLGS